MRFQFSWLQNYNIASQPVAWSLCFWNSFRTPPERIFQEFNFLFFDFPEENGTPADLSQRVVFKSKRSQKAEKLEEGSSQEKPKKSKRPEPAKSKLSFQDDEEEDE